LHLNKKNQNSLMILSMLFQFLKKHQ